ncbi:MAG: regulatory protein RecX [Syntrophus sp. (in: bacteria)]|jgi:regulatory protein|nr:regulatory protein RecX [Syntrophus sp. (in: bacteria)]
MIDGVLPGKDPREQARQKAWRLLQIRPHSERELWKKLRDRGFPPEVLADVFQELKDYRYLDDSAYARLKARHLAVERLLGDRRIELALRQKGLDAELIDAAIRETRQDFPEAEALQRLIFRMLKGGSPPGPKNRHCQKIVRSLEGKGFPIGQIFKILKSIKEEEELNDSIGA